MSYAGTPIKLLYLNVKYTMIIYFTDIPLLTPREPRGIEMGPGASSLEGASVGCAGCNNSQPTRPADET